MGKEQKQKGLNKDDLILIFHDWLRGLRENIELTLEDGSKKTFLKSPKLSDSKAFNIIYELQETLRVIPDKFEKCSKCGRIFDTESTGDHIDELDIEENKQFKKCDLGCFYCDTCLDKVYYYQDRSKCKLESYPYNISEFIEILNDVNLNKKIKNDT